MARQLGDNLQKIIPPNEKGIITDVPDRVSSIMSPASSDPFFAIKKIYGRKREKHYKEQADIQYQLAISDLQTT